MQLLTTAAKRSLRQWLNATAFSRNSLYERASQDKEKSM
jgi:Zn-dependent M16 (insulinase) family peptidase